MNKSIANKAEGLSWNCEPRIVAWEVTRSCNLNCVHCRASSHSGPYPHELNTGKAKQVLDQISEVGRPIIILTGGEPLLRKDVFTLAEYGTEKGLRMVMGTNGTLITPDIAKKIMASGIKRVSVSLDGATAERHDAFRQVDGCFDRALKGVACLKEQGVEFQINTTITKHNVFELKALLDLAVRLGAIAHHIFLLVPTGRGKEMANQALTAQEYEDTLSLFYELEASVPLQLKATCAPQYQRIIRQRPHAERQKVNSETAGLDAMTRGCLAGISYCFISNPRTVSGQPNCNVRVLTKS